jgi:hypothetical protein
MGDKAAIDGRFRAPSEATMPLPGRTDATRAIVGADTSAAMGAAVSDAASVVMGAIAAASTGRGIAVGAEASTEDAVRGVSIARDAGAVFGYPCSAACLRDSSRRAQLARVSASLRAILAA